MYLPYSSQWFTGMPKESTKRKENASDYFLVKKTRNFSVAVSSYLATKGSFPRSKAQMTRSRMNPRSELLKIRVNNSIAINLLHGFWNLRSKFPLFSSILYGLWSVFMDVSILGSGTIAQWKLIATTLFHTLIFRRKKSTLKKASKQRFT